MNRTEYHALRRERFNIYMELRKWGYAMSAYTLRNHQERIAEITRTITPAVRNCADSAEDWKRHCRRAAVEQRVADRRRRALVAAELAKLKPTGNRYADAFASLAVSFGGQTAEQARVTVGGDA